MKLKSIAALTIALITLPVMSYAKPLFTVRANAPTLNLSKNGSAVLTFNVTNTSGVNFSNGITYAANITANPLFQTTVSPNTGCGSSLANGASCTLVLNVQANGIATGTGIITPRVCYRNDCSTGSVATKSTTVTVSAAPGSIYKHAYIVNQANSTISLCNINSINGTLSGCTNAGATGLSIPTGITLLNTGTVTYAYISNFTANSVSICTVNPINQSLTGCINSNVTGLVSPVQVVFNAAGTQAYISSQNNNTITLCNVNRANGSLSGCTNAGATGLDEPNGFTLNQAGTLLYVTTPGNNAISICNVNTTSGMLSGCSSTSNALFSYPVGITFNLAQTVAYITNNGNNTTIVCSLNPSGSIGNCVDSGGTGFNGPYGIALNPSATNTYVYVANLYALNVSLCTIDPASNLFSSCTDSGAGNVFDNAVSIALF